MRFLINALAALALVIPVSLTAQQSDQSPACRGDLNGNQLTTAIEFPDGYTVEGAWQVEWNRPAALEDGAEGVAVGATLDHLIEVDPKTGERVVSPFPEPIETTFEGHDEEELVYRAAQIWCLTVLKAQGDAQPASKEQTRARAAAF